MILCPPGIAGAAFTTAGAGDMLRGSRSQVSAQLGIDSQWAWVSQVHGADLQEVDQPGAAGPGDALITGRPGLPLAVFTADCAGVVLHTDQEVAVAHAGWRGVAQGVVAKAVRHLSETALVRTAALGPLIGPCCFEVGEEVLDVLGDWECRTRWGSAGVDLPAAIRAQVPGVQWWSADSCTRCGDGWFSHRADATPKRLVAIGWLP